MDDDIYIREDKGGSEDDYEMAKAEVALEPEGSSRTSLEFEADDFVISVEKEETHDKLRRRKQEDERKPLLQHDDDHWIHTVDNEFAQTFLDRLIGYDDLPRSSYSSALCKRCNSVNLGASVTIRILRKKLSPCLFCRLQPRLSQAVKDRSQFLNAPSLRICASPKSKTAHPDVQIGFPILLAPDSPIRFDLFREWLRVCDQSHSACSRRGSMVGLSIRVVDVGVGDEDPNILRLSTLGPGDGENPRNDYVALSYCRGDLTEEETKVFCTSGENFEERFEQGFELPILPQTFQDAVTVTRKLGKRYLWIDSLCIIQYGDDFRDWERETRKMESVFRNAYCTIAATSASDPTVGFLERSPVQDPDLRFIKANSALHGRIYVSATADNFREDVEHGALSQRAWALQERALARRTIHFTSNQAYFECGDGVRCETLSYMRNSKAPFLGDPYFPESFSLRNGRDKVRLFQSLFETYSQLAITNATDRPLAISGLEQRLATTFKSKCSYGTFEKYLHRSLLWQRSEPAKLSRIQFPANTDVPSWSWMAYEGKIKYLKIESDDVEWSEELQLSGNTLRAHVRRFKNCTMERDDMGNYIIMDTKEIKPTSGWLRYDGKHRPHVRKHRFVIIGRKENAPRGRSGRPESDATAKYYVLVVIQTDSQDERAYKRIGVGCIPAGCIVFREGRSPENIV